MNIDKLLKYVMAIVIVAYVIYLSLPNIKDFIVNTRQVIDETKQEFRPTLIINYLVSKPDYYFTYEGATYCIPVETLVNENVITENEEYKIGDIVEASVVNGEYLIQINNECIEK